MNIIDLKTKEKWAGRIVSAAPTKFRAPMTRGGEAGRGEKYKGMESIGHASARVIARLRMHRL